MKITRDNYESFFVDYLEGNLEENMMDQFLDFLKQHPDLQEELQLFEEIGLPQEPVKFEGKQSLYREGGSESFDLKAAAYMEGDLAEDERIAFEAILKGNARLEAEYALMQKTRLRPDMAIRYEDKEKLYKRSGTVLWLNWTARVAAVLVLAWGIHSLFQTGSESRIATPSGEVASVEVPATALPQAPGHTSEEEQQKDTELLAAKTATVTEPAVKATESMAHKGTNGNRGQQLAGIPSPATTDREVTLEREPQQAAPIAPLMARLDNEPAGEQELVAINPVNTEKINDPHNIMTLDEYVALRARRVTNEGILSANRLIRAGLNVASELSGDRLGYTVKNGKVASLGFESRLLAFEIPLEKK